MTAIMSQSPAPKAARGRVVGRPESRRERRLNQTSPARAAVHSDRRAARSSAFHTLSISLAKTEKAPIATQLDKIAARKEPRGECR